MKKLLYFFTFIMLLLSYDTSNAQANVLDPSDPDVIFTSTNQPAYPTYAKMSKWGHTNRLSWNPYSYGFKSYYFKGMAFRVKFPKSYMHNVADGKVYPAIIFLHGLGESGNIWDNEYQLLHGGQTHAQKVDDGTFDGFLIYPQSQNGYLQSYFPQLKDLADSMAKYVKLDPDRLHIGGLSGGGQATWDFPDQQLYAQMACALEPISAARYENVNYFASHITIPVLIANGGQDVAPYPATVTDIINSYKNLGGNITQAFFPTLGHGAWDAFWADPRYWPFINAQHKANPLVFFQHNKFCPGDTVNAQLGLQAGFYAYQWDKDGVTIPGQTANQYVVTSYGTYRGRFKRKATSQWSVWSPIPAVIAQNTVTVSPAIQLNGLYSNILPAPDGSTTVPLFVASTYASYEWRRVSDNALVSSTNSYNAPVGQYKVKVTEQFGCGSNFSDPYTVVSADGINKPDAASSFSAIAISNSAIQLYWNVNPNPKNKQTAFEIYRSLNSGSGYVFIGTAGADSLSFLDQGLSAHIKYYYIIRAIDATAASAVSAEVNAITQSDINPPTSPANLKVTGSTRSSVTIAWDAATDDIGVAKYQVYLNGVKSYITTFTTFTVNNLTALSTNSFFVKALDATGNVSPASNQVTATASLNGLTYKYYEGSWNLLPDFNTLTPLAIGNTANVSLAPSFKTTQFGFLWEGFIIIPVTGTYTFETNSDDGSKLYIGTYSNAATPLVNNDGLHGGQYRGGAITLNAGVYPFSATFFQQGGGKSMNIYWTCAAAGFPTRTVIPNSAFSDLVTIPTNLLPQQPADLKVTGISYNTINLNWSDSSNNETGFEVYRSTSQIGTYVNIGTTAAGTTSFIDSVGLLANTKYWYKIRSVNQSGQSQFVSTPQAIWKLNNNYNDESGNNRTLTGNATPVFNAADKKEGTYSVSLNGSTQYLNLPFSTSGVYPADSYATRSIGIWIKPNSSMLNVTSLNKVIYDFGGSDNGIALRFNAGALQAGIASANNRFTVSANNVSSDPNWVANNWNHITVVYNVNKLQLFINGVLVGSTNLTFSSVAASANGSRIGAVNSTNAFNSLSSSTNYFGLLDDIEIISEPINGTGILALMNQSYAAATTLLLPTIPSTPTNLISTIKTTTSISLQFNDNSTNETSFELYRSTGNINNYRLMANIAGGDGSTKTYFDNSLFSNSDYYYKVRAKGVGGTTPFTPDLQVRTNDNPPVITHIASFTMRYESQKTILLSATDLDLEPLSFSFISPLPSFAVFNNTGNGTGSLQLNPATTDQGVYTISAVVADGFNGKDTTTFTVTVNANYTPVINTLNDITLPESNTSTVNLTANDQDGNNTLTWALASTLPFVNIVDNGNGVGVLSIAPGYSDAGVYPVTVNVSDGAGATESATFILTVTNLEPPVEKWFISPKYDSPDAPAPWNVISSVSTSNLLNNNGVSTAVGIDFLNTSWNGGDAGAVTGNNSGVYPDAVIKDYFWFGAYNAPNTVDFVLRSLAIGARYNVTLFGSSAWTGLGNNGTTVYTINGNAKPLYVDKNQQNTVTFSSIAADSSGNITVNMSKGVNTPYGLVNAIVLQKPFDDGTTPVLPTNIAAEALSNGSVKLSWKDIAYNENNYLIHRATIAGGPFTLLNPDGTNANDTTYIDNNVLSNTLYYYYIEATNNAGSSGNTNTVSVAASNKSPLLSVIADVYVKAGSTISVTVAPTDDAGDVLTTTVTGLPSFGAFQSTGNGTGNIIFNPTADVLGTYSGIAVTVTDSYGASITTAFNVTVTDNSVRSVYLNFGPDGAIPQPAPWNNFLGYPFINNSFGGIKDDANMLTTFTFKFLTQWNSGSTGMRTGNNKGVFPDNVMRTSFINSNAGSHVIQFDGLNPAKLYSIGFLTNINTGASSLVTFTNGTQTVTADSKYNTTRLANLNGLIPSQSGSIQVTITKGTATTILSLNGVVIREYDPADPVIKPADLFAETLIKTDRIKLSWSDRSNDETGFEVWRSTSADGSYSFVTANAASVSSYTDSGLTANNRYFYKVRAIKGAQVSDFSNIANAILAANIVLLNLNVNAAQAAPSPWNSTSSPSTAGSTFSNLKNVLQINSGFEMDITKEFNGSGYAGVNADGVFPANVMVSNYWTDAGQTSQVKFQNLDISKKYRIGCFGSNINNDYTTANYSCNGKTVELNSYFNDAKVVFLDNLIPGNDGELVISVSTAAGSPYSFTGAYTIEYFDDTTKESINNTIYPDGLPGSLRTINNPAPNKHNLPALNAVAKKVELLPDYNLKNIKVYPNPFTNVIKLELSMDKQRKVDILLYDINGNLRFRSNELQVMKGTNTLTLKLGESTPLPLGVYMMSILIDGKISETQKLVKGK